MDIWFNPALDLDRIIRSAAPAAGLASESFNPDIRPADPRFGDFQANGVLPAAKRMQTNPRELATNLVDALEASHELDPELVETTVAGPGFINFRFTPKFLLCWLQQYKSTDDLRQAAGQYYHGKKIVVDFSSPNTAKQMHVGHIRSTVIGEAVSRILSFAGADVTRDNHIGDWGTQFGILIMAMRRKQFTINPDAEDPIADLENLYREGSALAKEDETALQEARGELVKLQQGDPDNLAAWEAINKVSYDSFQKIYDRLGVRFDAVLGESFYRDKVDRIYNELTETGLAEESDGALVVFHPEHKRFCKQPFIIRKSDGASNYATTDLATVLYRVEALGAESIIYITDARQKDHFEQLFLTVRKWFEAKGRKVPQLTHITFGTILGPDRKAIKTRSGESVKLKDLLQESVERARAIVQKKNPDLDDEALDAIGEAVGVGAVRYADLMQNRSSDYIFAWDKMLSFDGNTAPYLLYATARLHSIYRRANLMPGDQEAEPSQYETEEEIALARKLLGFVNALNQSLSDMRPHFLSGYLYELSGVFSTFYNANRVIVDEPEVRARRLILCARTLHILETGLRLLGLTTLERM